MRWEKHEEVNEGLRHRTTAQYINHSVGCPTAPIPILNHTCPHSPRLDSKDVPKVYFVFLQTVMMTYCQTFVFPQPLGDDYLRLRP